MQQPAAYGSAPGVTPDTSVPRGVRIGPAEPVFLEGASHLGGSPRRCHHGQCWSSPRSCRPTQPRRWPRGETGSDRAQGIESSLDSDHELLPCISCDHQVVALARNGNRVAEMRGSGRLLGRRGRPRSQEKYHSHLRPLAPVRQHPASAHPGSLLQPVFRISRKAIAAGAWGARNDGANGRGDIRERAPNRR